MTLCVTIEDDFVFIDLMICINLDTLVDIYI